MAAQLTPSGRSAVAVIGLRGSSAGRFLRQCFTPSTDRPYQPDQVRYGVWTSTGEAVVVTPLGPNWFEIHAHGGVAATEKVLASLEALGVARVDAASWGHDEHAECLVSEAETVLIHCSTVRNAGIAMNQVRAGLNQWVEDWLAGEIELHELHASTREVLSWACVGRHLVAPYRVVLAGPPNVGKSSLINRLVGFGRAITHNAPGTTRDVLECDTVIAGINFRLSDTAGIRDDGDAIELEGIRRGALAISQSDLVIAVVSPSCAGELDRIRDNLADRFPGHPVLEVLNQADRLDDQGGESDMALPTIQTIAIDQTGDSQVDDGIEALTDAIVQVLRPRDPPAKQAIPLNARQVHCLQRIEQCRDLDAAVACLHRLKDGRE